MKVNEILKKFNEYSLEDQKRANMFHVEMDVAVLGMNNIELEDKLYDMLEEDDIEVQYVNAERTDFKNESLNEDMSNQDLYDIVYSRGQEVAMKTNHVVDRLRYRLLDNVSYTGNDAKKLAWDVDDKLRDILKTLDDCYNLIG